MKLSIFYMSGTGNSYYVARTIGEAFEQGEIIHIESLPHSGSVSVSSDVIGFVFPSYCLDIPKPFEHILQKLSIENKQAFVFSVVTHNGLPGRVFKTLSKILSHQNVHLNYATTLKMPGNSVIIKDYVSSKEEQEKRHHQVSQRLPQIIEDIKHRKQQVETIRINPQSWIKGKSSKLWIQVLYRLPNHFHVDESCNHCGICEKVCSFNNIHLINQKPTWDHHCESCLACFHNCPKHAIQLDNYTKNSIRYRHPQVAVDELMNK